MKVCFLVGTLGRGGAEKQLLFMLRALKQKGVAVRVVCLTRGECFENEIKKEGIKIEWLGKSKYRIVRLLQIIHNLRNAPADVVQSSHFYTNIYAALTGKMLGIVSIGAIRSNLDSEVEAHGFLGKWQISLPDFLIANSQTACKRISNYGISPTKTAFVPNVVEFIAPAPPKPFLSDNSITFLWVGRLVESKKTERFIKMAVSLNEIFTSRNLNFLIAGDGARRGELVKLAADLHLSKRTLEFLGDCPNMDEVYKQADIVVSTSDYEGTPNVVLEAMAHGLPVIAAKVGGMPDLLGEERGILVEPDSSTQFIKAAATMISHSCLRKQYGANGQKYVEKNHSSDYLGKRLIKIYENLLQKKIEIKKLKS